MAHSVAIRKLPLLELENSDIIFDVRQNDELLGSLRISKGQVVWRPKNFTHGYWLYWADFHQLMMQNGKRRKVNY